MENFLTCFKLAEHLRDRIIDEESGKFFEETALRDVYKTLFTNVSVAELKLLFVEIPKILTLDYPVVQNIFEGCLGIIPQLMNLYRVNNAWKNFTELEYLLEMLRSFKKHEHK